MYLDTTILQSRTTDTLIEFIRDIIGVPGDELTPEQQYKFGEIKRQHRRAKKLEEPKETK